MRKCSICKLPATPVVLPEFSGAFSDYSVSFVGLPALACGEAGHPRYYVHPDFGFELINALHEALPLTVRRILRRSLCRGCRAPIDGKPARSSTVFAIEVVTKRAPAFSAALSGRTLICTHCGTEQLSCDRTFFGDMPDSVIGAFESARLQR
jgi:hypothetical protein